MMLAKEIRQAAADELRYPLPEKQEEAFQNCEFKKPPDAAKGH